MSFAHRLDYDFFVDQTARYAFANFEGETDADDSVRDFIGGHASDAVNYFAETAGQILDYCETENALSEFGPVENLDELRGVAVCALERDILSAYQRLVDEAAEDED